MLHPIGFVFLLLWTTVLGENCIINNFESDFENPLHSNTNICANQESWQLDNYTSTDIMGVPHGSSHFIQPKSVLSCGATMFYAMSEGTLEVNVYMKPNSQYDFLSVFVIEKIDDHEVVHGHAYSSRDTPGLKDGWNVVKMDLHRSFTGYITFMGMQTDDSILLIDSYRFYTESYENYCQIYAIEEITDSITTDESSPELTENPDSEYEITTATPNAPATPIPEIDTTDPESIPTDPADTEKCVTYNFDSDFDSLFTHQHDLCDSFDTWELNNYSTDGIATFNGKGKSYLTPNEDLSCISAFPIRMSPDGVVEVNVYIEPASDFDYVIVLVKNVVEGSVDTVAGSYIYEPSLTTFVRGWNVLRINVVNLRSFDGYLVLLGAASRGSTVIVDSFRYIPPWASADDEECQIR